MMCVYFPSSLTFTLRKRKDKSAEAIATRGENISEQKSFLEMLEMLNEEKLKR